MLTLSATLNDESKMVVEYWADPTGSQTPPGHWTRICEFVSARDNHTLADVRMRPAVLICTGQCDDPSQCMSYQAFATPYGQIVPPGSPT